MDKIKFKKIQVIIKTQKFSVGSYAWQSCLRGEHISNSNVFLWVHASLNEQKYI